MNIKNTQIVQTIKLIIGFTIIIAGVIAAKLTNYYNLIVLVSGLGGGLIGSSAMKLFQIKKSPEKYEKRLIELSDERNITIRGYAGYATFITTLLAIGLTTLAFLFLDYTVSMIVGAGLLLIHIISFFIFSAYYGKKI